jgi:hypothetical protein
MLGASNTAENMSSHRADTAFDDMIKNLDARFHKQIEAYTESSSRREHEDCI